jgi:hypothetical protein
MGRHKGTYAFPGGEVRLDIKDNPFASRASISVWSRIRYLQPEKKPKSETGWFLVDQSLVKERKGESFALTDIFTLDRRGPDKC